MPRLYYMKICLKPITQASLHTLRNSSVRESLKAGHLTGLFFPHYRGVGIPVTNDPLTLVNARVNNIPMEGATPPTVPYNFNAYTGTEVKDLTEDGEGILLGYKVESIENLWGEEATPNQKLLLKSAPVLRLMPHDDFKVKEDDYEFAGDNTQSERQDS